MSPAARNCWWAHLCAEAQLQAEMIWDNAEDWAVGLGLGFVGLEQAMIGCLETHWGSRRVKPVGSLASKHPSCLSYAPNPRPKIAHQHPPHESISSCVGSKQSQSPSSKQGAVGWAVPSASHHCLFTSHISPHGRLLPTCPCKWP